MRPIIYVKDLGDCFGSVAGPFLLYLRTSKQWHIMGPDWED